LREDVLHGLTMEPQNEEEKGRKGTSYSGAMIVTVILLFSWPKSSLSVRSDSLASNVILTFASEVGRASGGKILSQCQVNAP
jgi:hypothetical protein